MKEILFCSTRGNLYTPKEAKRIVKARLHARWGDLLEEGWRDRVDSAFADENWVRFRNGSTPASLVYDLEDVALLGEDHKP